MTVRAAMLTEIGVTGCEQPWDAHLHHYPGPTNLLNLHPPPFASCFPVTVHASTLRAPRFSRLEADILTDGFGVAVRMACVDASAPYKLPLQDQHMLPEPESLLPVCLVQRFNTPLELTKEKDAEAALTAVITGQVVGRTGRIFDARASSLPGLGATGDGHVSPPISPVLVSAFGKNSSRPDSVSKSISPRGVSGAGSQDSVERKPFFCAHPALSTGDGDSGGAASPSPQYEKNDTPVRALERIAQTFGPQTMALAKSSGDSSPDSSPASSPTTQTSISLTPTPRGRSLYAMTDRGGPDQESIRNRSEEQGAVSGSHLFPPESPVGGQQSSADDGRDGGRTPWKSNTWPSSKWSGYAPSTPPSRRARKNSRSLSPFFGNRTMVFMSPISQRRARAQWGATTPGRSRSSAAAAAGSGGGDAVISGERILSKREGKTRLLRKVSRSVVVARSHGRTSSEGCMRMTGMVRDGTVLAPAVLRVKESPIVVPGARRRPPPPPPVVPPPDGGVVDLDGMTLSPPPPRMLPLANAFAAASSKQTTPKTGRNATPVKRPSMPSPPPPPPPALQGSSPLQGTSPRPAGVARRRSMSNSPRRPPPKQMTGGTASTDGNDGKERSGPISGGPIPGTVSGPVPRAVSGSVPDGGSGRSDSISRPRSAVESPRTEPRSSKSGKSPSLLDGVEQSSDLGGFFRRGESIQRKSQWFRKIILSSFVMGR